MKLLKIDHVQLAMPEGQEDVARRFYSQLLELPEIPKPASLQARGGVWFGHGELQLHLGVEKDFRPAKKAHPAFLVRGLHELKQRLSTLNFKIDDDANLPGYARFYVEDPFGNRIELLEPISA